MVFKLFTKQVFVFRPSEWRPIIPQKNYLACTTTATMGWLRSQLIHVLQGLSQSLELNPI